MSAEVQSFFQGFNFDTLLALISCVASIVALFLGGTAYRKCQINKKIFNDRKEFKDDSQDYSQKAGRDIINNGCDATALATLTAANFEVSLKKAYNQFEQKTTANLYHIINETNRIIQENKVDLGAYTKIDWINVYFENAKNTSDVYMQSVWARVLAKELSTPGRFSFKTLDILKSMSSDDFHLFEKLCSVQFNGCILKENNTEARITWVEQLKLQEFGLINLDDTTRVLDILPGGKNDIIDSTRQFVIILENNSEQRIQVEYDLYLLSSASMELLDVAIYEVEDDYFVDFAKNLKEKYAKKVNISLHTLISMEDMQYQYMLDDLIEEN